MGQPLAGEVATFPFPRTCPFGPPPEYGRLRAEEPVSRVRMLGGNSAWLIARHDDVRKVLSDPRMSVDRRRTGFPRFASITEAELQASFRGFRRPLNWLDPPEHTAARRSVMGEFTVRRMRALRPRVQAIVDGCLDRMLAGPRPTDLMHAFALPVPSLVICELLGIPYAEHAYFEARTTRMLSGSGPAEDRTRAAHEVRAYLDSLVAAKERRPTDDLLGRLISRQRLAGEEDHEAVVSMAFVLLVAGHVTTASMIALGTLALFRNPEQRAAMVADPALTPGAVEEMLRYFTIVNAATARTALADVEIGGVAIRTGDGVVALGPAANRDPEVFDHPDEFDIRRDARQHVAFGFGRHQCLGQNLARLELQVAFDSLFGRVPGLRLAGAIDDLPFRTIANVYGVDELPVTW